MKLEAEKFGGIDLGHAINFGDGEAVAVQVLVKLEQAVGVERIAGLAEIAREDTEFGTDLADTLRIEGGRVGIGFDPFEFEISAEPGGFLHLGDGHTDERIHSVSDEDILNALAARFADEEEGFGRGGVAGFEHEVVPGDDGNHFHHFGHEVAVFGDARERAVLAGGSDLVFGIERGHPHHFPVASLDLGHKFDCGGIDAADSEVERNAAEDFDAGDLFADHVGERSGGLVMVLEDERTHAAGLGEAGEVDGVDGTRGAIGAGMGVHVDGAGEGLGRRGQSREEEGSRPRKIHRISISGSDPCDGVGFAGDKIAGATSGWRNEANSGGSGGVSMGSGSAGDEIAGATSRSCLRAR